jgi:hypothetical protein
MGLQPAPLSSRQRIFALLIGIDEYESVKKLGGCVADVEDVYQYLTQSGVQENRIKKLHNAQAKRKDIIQALKDLQTNEQITLGDPIFIFYAGHGSETATPPGWVSGAANIQTMVPQDCESPVDGQEVVHAIPDRTLGFLLWKLAQEKGDNIVRFFPSLTLAEL